MAENAAAAVAAAAAAQTAANCAATLTSILLFSLLIFQSFVDLWCFGFTAIGSIASSEYHFGYIYCTSVFGQRLTKIDSVFCSLCLLVFFFVVFDSVSNQRRARIVPALRVSSLCVCVCSMRAGQCVRHVCLVAITHYHCNCSSGNIRQHSIFRLPFPPDFY